MRLAQDWTGAKQLNILDYQPVPIQVILSYCFYTWAVQLIRGEFHIYPSAGSGSSKPSSVFIESSQLKKLMEQEKWESGNTKTVDGQTLMEAF